MGFSLKRLVKGAVKIGKKIAPQLLKATPVGQLAVRAQQAAKSLGVNFRAAKKKHQPVSVQAPIARPMVTMMASGAPQRARRLRGSGLKNRDDQAYSVGGMLSRPSGSRRKAKVSSGKGRTPPKGGLDLKRMSAAWKAAGKPGTWINWIRENPIKTR